MGIDVTRAIIVLLRGVDRARWHRRHPDRAALRGAADMGTLFGLKAFAVAILGGLGSARGVVLAGFLFGVSRRSSPRARLGLHEHPRVPAGHRRARDPAPAALLGQAAVKKV